MKKILFLLLLTGCRVVSSVYATNINYWSFQIAQNTILISQEGQRLINAQKAHKEDSVLIYAFNLNSLVVLQLQYKDSLLYYINK